MEAIQVAPETIVCNWSAVKPTGHRFGWVQALEMSPNNEVKLCSLNQHRTRMGSSSLLPQISDCPWPPPGNRLGLHRVSQIVVKPYGTASSLVRRRVHFLREKLNLNKSQDSPSPEPPAVVVNLESYQCRSRSFVPRYISAAGPKI